MYGHNAPQAHSSQAHKKPTHDRHGGAGSSSGAGGGGGVGSVPNRYLCALFGLIRYDPQAIGVMQQTSQSSAAGHSAVHTPALTPFTSTSSFSAGAPGSGGGVGGGGASHVPTSLSSTTATSLTPAAVPSIARLLALLRSLVHSDGQALICGRQSQVTLDLPLTKNQLVAVHGHIARSSSGHTPTTPQSPFPLASPSSNTALRSPLHANNALSQSLTSPFAFANVSSFHQASNLLLDQTHNAPLSPASLLTMPTFTAASISNDQAYLIEREKRLAPIVNMVSATSPWSLLVPGRFSRYVRVFRSEDGNNSSGNELHVWREIDLPSQAHGAPFFQTQSTAASPSASSPASNNSIPFPGYGGAHENWRLSALGKSHLASKTLCHVRPIRVMPISANFQSMLIPTAAGSTPVAGQANGILGYKLDYEYVEEGFRFEDRDGIELLIIQVLKVPILANIASATMIKGNRWMCEVRCLVLEEMLQTQQTKVQAYSKALEQFVKFTKFTPEGAL